jgi:hypothetical protein
MPYLFSPAYQFLPHRPLTLLEITIIAVNEGYYILELEAYKIYN